jgi:hypothetical protein
LQIIQTNSQERIYLNVYSNGDLTLADTLPRVSIYDADNNATAITGYSNQVVTDENGDGLYSFLLKPNVTNLKRVLEVVWTYTQGGIQATNYDYFSVETVYAGIGEITDFLGFGTEPSDLNYYDPKAIASAEKFARTIIDGYTGQKFSTYYGSQEQYGKGSDAIYLTEKMLTIDKVWENDILLIDNTVSPAVNTFGFALELSPTGKTLRILNMGWDVRYDNNVDPNILYYGRFRDNARYKIQGQIGYKYVPEDIKIAAMLLVNDILSNDYNWRNKYLKKVDLSEISFEMAGGAFNGTGNVAVDNILDQYRNVNIVVI